MSAAEELARRIAAITAAEPHLLRRSAREIRRALDEGRGVVLGADEPAGPTAFLFFFPYAGWAEIGAAWVRPDARGRGTFAAMHDELLPRIRARGLVAFEFPGSPLVERALVRLGATRAPLTTLPARVLLRFAAERATPAKLSSYVHAVRAGTHRTSTRLYLFPEPHDKR